MKFFVPLFEDKGQLLWNVVRSQLFMRDRFTTDRRIRALLWQGGGDHEQSIIVGEEMPGGEDGDVVLVIHESSVFPEMMFVCTLGMFRDRAAPAALALTKSWRVVDFDDSPRPTPVRKRTRPEPAPARTGKRRR